MQNYTLTKEQEAWASKRKHGLGKLTLRELIKKQEGKCALSGVDLKFNKKKYGTPVAKGDGCHPLYAAVDHISPSNNADGHQIVCYDLNDLKGHLPKVLFEALRKTSAWGNFIKKWQTLADRGEERKAFKELIGTG